MKSEILNAERSEAGVDAFTAEVIRSALVAITGEMKTNLMRTAYHTIIYEAEDFTVGLFDADGNTISIGLGLPMFIRGLSDAIKAKIAHWGKENIEPGDILLTNDSYTMGSHLNHMIFTLPIFNDGELVAFSSSMAHWQDVGGQLGGVTRDIFSEGLQTAVREKFPRRHGESRDHVDHPRQRARARAGHGRSCARSSRRSAPASGASCTCSSATAIRPSRTASGRFTNRAKDWRAPRWKKFPTAFTKPNRSWTTTASISASIFRSKCGSKYAAIR